MRLELSGEPGGCKAGAGTGRQAEESEADAVETRSNAGLVEFDKRAAG